MPDEQSSWGKIHEEYESAIRAAAQAQPGAGIIQIDLDSIMKRHVDELFQATGRPILFYLVDFFNGAKAATSGNEVAILQSDKDGIVETTRTLPPGPLDIILHSPGGSLEATESIVDILRQKFTHIRFFIPNTAKSAATMLALSGDEIYLASSAELGPIDPQMVIRRDGGTTQSPAQSVIDQFEYAQKELSAHPERLPAWIPILPIYGPSLYNECKLAVKLSKEVVRTWLIKYMFKDLPKKRDRVNRARRVVNYFANTELMKSHGRKICLTDLDENLKDVLNVKRLDDDPVLYDKVMAVYYCFLQLFQRSPAFKVIQNSAGQKYIRQIQMAPQMQPFPLQRPQS